MAKQSSTRQKPTMRHVREVAKCDEASWLANIPFGSCAHFGASTCQWPTHSSLLSNFEVFGLVSGSLQPCPHGQWQPVGWTVDWSALSQLKLIGTKFWHDRIFWKSVSNGTPTRNNVAKTSSSWLSPAKISATAGVLAPKRTKLRDHNTGFLQKQIYGTNYASRTVWSMRFVLWIYNHQSHSASFPEIVVVENVLGKSRSTSDFFPWVSALHFILGKQSQIMTLARCKKHQNKFHIPPITTTSHCRRNDRDIKTDGLGI